MAARIEDQIAGREVLLEQTEPRREGAAADVMPGMWEIFIDGRPARREDLLQLLRADQDPKHDPVREVIGATRR